MCARLWVFFQVVFGVETRGVCAQTALDLSNNELRVVPPELGTQRLNYGYRLSNSTLFESGRDWCLGREGHDGACSGEPRDLCSSALELSIVPKSDT